MRSSIDCVPCFIRQALDASRMVTSDETVIKVMMKKVLAAMSDFDLSLTPPEAGRIIHRIIREAADDPDPYYKLKERSTLRALELSAAVKAAIVASKKPFETAVRFSIAGNIMDFGMKSAWDESHIMSSFEKAEKEKLAINTIENLYRDIKNARTVLVIGDNAGETVFDRLLIESFPGKADVFYAVKGSPVINDATADDARKAGIDKVARILSNGVDSQGTLLAECSEEFLSVFDGADVIISKGQGNFETLNNAARKIYFLFQVKCAVIADFYNFRHGEWLVRHGGVESDNLNNEGPK